MVELLANPVVVGPMAGISDAVFRSLIWEQGPALVWTEMISAQALLYDNRRTWEMVRPGPGEGPLVVQLFGKEPDLMAEAATKVMRFDPAVIDINMGCPAPKIVNNGEGAALLKTPDLAVDILKAVNQAVGRPVTAKIRLGWDPDHIIAPPLAEQLADAGAAAITVHGRTRSQFYGGRADWGQIRRVKEAVRIPIIGNGDVFTPQAAKEMLVSTGVDAVMLARGVLGNPWLVGRTVHYLATGKVAAEPELEERLSMVLRHLELATIAKGEQQGLVQMRKHLAWYTKGLPGAAGFRGRIMNAQAVDEVKEMLKQYFRPGRRGRA